MTMFALRERRCRHISTAVRSAPRSHPYC